MPVSSSSTALRVSPTRLNASSNELAGGASPNRTRNSPSRASFGGPPPIGRQPLLRRHYSFKGIVRQRTALDPRPRVGSRLPGPWLLRPEASSQARLQLVRGGLPPRDGSHPT